MKEATKAWPTRFTFPAFSRGAGTVGTGLGCPKPGKDSCTIGTGCDWFETLRRTNDLEVIQGCPDF